MVMQGLSCSNPEIIPQQTPPEPGSQHDQALSWQEYHSLSSGRELYVNKCSGCHQLYGVKQYSDGEWRLWLENMKEEITITSEEEILIRDFLFRYN